MNIRRKLKSIQNIWRYRATRVSNLIYNRWKKNTSSLLLVLICTTSFAKIQDTSRRSGFVTGYADAASTKHHTWPQWLSSHLCYFGWRRFPFSLYYNEILDFLCLAPLLTTISWKKLWSFFVVFLSFRGKLFCRKYILLYSKQKLFRCVKCREIGG